MEIIEKVREKKSELQRDKSGTLADKNRGKAVAAVHAGIRSTEWTTYMEQYADTPAQLARLTGEDGTAYNENIKLARAYLVANAVCGAGTLTELDRTVDGIDDGLPQDA